MKKKNFVLFLLFVAILVTFVGEYLVDLKSWIFIMVISVVCVFITKELEKAQKQSQY